MLCQELRDTAEVVTCTTSGTAARVVCGCSHTHAVRAITHPRVMGMGPLYQGCFKSLPVQTDGHLLTLLRYVQRDPMRAKLAKSASDWRWSGEWVRMYGEKEARAILSHWPVDRPRSWTKWVDEPENAQETKAIPACVRRSSPSGTDDWTQETAQRLNLEWTLRPRGRPPKEANEAT